MTILWLIIWMLSNTPQVMFSPLNNWGIALLVCILIDILKLK